MGGCLTTGRFISLYLISGLTPTTAGQVKSLKPTLNIGLCPGQDG